MFSITSSWFFSYFDLRDFLCETVMSHVMRRPWLIFWSCGSPDLSPSLSPSLSPFGELKDVVVHWRWVDAAPRREDGCRVDSLEASFFTLIRRFLGQYLLLWPSIGAVVFNLLDSLLSSPGTSPTTEWFVVELAIWFYRGTGESFPSKLEVLLTAPYEPRLEILRLLFWLFWISPFISPLFWFVSTGWLIRCDYWFEVTYELGSFSVRSNI